MSIPFSPFVVRAKPRSQAADFFNRGDRGLLHIHRLATARRRQPSGIAQTYFRILLTAAARGRSGSVAPKRNLSYHRSRKQ
jgi:hypothetical protein